MAEVNYPPLEGLLPIFSVDKNKDEPPSNKNKDQPLSNNSLDPEEYGAFGAAAGFAARTGPIRRFFEILVKSGVPPEQAIKLATTQVLTQSPTDMRPGAQPAGATSSQIMVPGRMESGDKWAKAIGGPGGDTTQQAVANFHMRNT